MIASEEKITDLQALADLGSIAEIAYKFYGKTQNPEVLEHIYTIAQTMEWLKNRINTHDYKDIDLSPPH